MLANQVNSLWVEPQRYSFWVEVRKIPLPKTGFFNSQAFTQGSENVHKKCIIHNFFFYLNFLIPTSNIKKNLKKNLYVIYFKKFDQLYISYVKYNYINVKIMLTLILTKYLDYHDINIYNLDL